MGNFLAHHPHKIFSMTRSKMSLTELSWATRDSNTPDFAYRTNTQIFILLAHHLPVTVTSSYFTYIQLYILNDITFKTALA